MPVVMVWSLVGRSFDHGYRYNQGGALHTRLLQLWLRAKGYGGLRLLDVASGVGVGVRVGV